MGLTLYQWIFSQHNLISSLDNVTIVLAFLISFTGILDYVERVLFFMGKPTDCMVELN